MKRHLANTVVLSATVSVAIVAAEACSDDSALLQGNDGGSSSSSGAGSGSSSGSSSSSGTISSTSSSSTSGSGSTGSTSSSSGSSGGLSGSSSGGVADASSDAAGVFDSSSDEVGVIDASSDAAGDDGSAPPDASGNAGEGDAGFPPDCTNAPVATWIQIYNQVVQPLCGNYCHNDANSNTLGGGLDLSPINASLAWIDLVMQAPQPVYSMCYLQGVRVFPGNPEKSLVYQKLINRQTCGGPMPHGDADGSVYSTWMPLPARQICDFYTWIKAGATDS